MYMYKRYSRVSMTCLKHQTCATCPPYMKVQVTDLGLRILYSMLESHWKPSRLLTSG